MEITCVTNQSSSMPLREVGAERAHFGGEHALVTETVNGMSKYFWQRVAIIATGKWAARNSQLKKHATVKFLI